MEYTVHSLLSLGDWYMTQPNIDQKGHMWWMKSVNAQANLLEARSIFYVNRKTQTHVCWVTNLLHAQYIVYSQFG